MIPTTSSTRGVAIAWVMFTTFSSAGALPASEASRGAIDSDRRSIGACLFAISWWLRRFPFEAEKRRKEL